MFENISDKIKTLAKITTIVGIAFSIIFGLCFLIVLNQILLGLAIAVLGSLASWVGSFVLYGFGELIENTSRPVYTQSNSLVKPTGTNEEHKPFYANTATAPKEWYCSCGALNSGSSTECSACFKPRSK